MDVEKAIGAKIEPKLRDAFGPTITRSLLTMATLAYVTTVGPKVQRYRALVDSICSDEGVVQQWGEANSAKQAREWKELVRLDSETVVIVTSEPSG
ncbi:MAG: hypothetical protein CEE40_06860 [Chloroflexi bacterium B3_Chlor]|nr:MAG: hypothetical protein CEE40_06860 [Chloroflexi bacterium B3_Chlor]